MVVIKNWTQLLILVLLFASCARAPLVKRADSMRLAKNPPTISDTLSKESFFSALKKHIDEIKKSRMVKDQMIFGNKTLDKIVYLNSLEKILDHQDDWINYIRHNFDFYEVYGKDSWGEVLATGYYEPRVLGSKVPSEKYSQPLYMNPDDMVTIDYKAFGLKPWALQGRLHDKIVSPYYTRSEIDSEFKLKNRNLELVYLEPVDAFFIHIQGSGIVDLGNGESMHVGYDSQNGFPYMAIGKLLTDFIPIEKMSMRKIREHLKTLQKKEQQNILNKNPSYVFFKKLDTAAITYSGAEVSTGRTIATDKAFFPKGAMAFLEIEEPVFSTIEDIEATSWIKKPRFVFDQDTGGAITGGGRVDLYFGIGDDAAQKAGVMRHPGRLYYLLPR